MSKYLATELVEKILFKLPVKSLLRFLSVSREWHKIITNLQSYRNHTSFLLGRSTREGEYIFWIDNGGTFEEYARYEPRVEDGFKSEVYFNSCANGLICFSDYERAVVWNPAIRRSFLLPQSNVKSLCRHRYAFGIVVDHITNEFKILRSDSSFNEISMEIYRQSTGLWELINSKAPFCEIHGYQVDLKGISYWIALGFDDGCPILVSFDGHTELFGKIKIHVPGPGDADDSFWFDCEKYLFLFEEPLVSIHSVDKEEDSDKDHNVENGQFSFKESLVFIHSVHEDEDSDEDDDDYNGQFTFTYKIWKMQVSEGKSWNLWSKISFNRVVQPIGFRKNGELVWAGEFCYVYTTLRLEFTRRLISMNLDKGSEFCIGRSYRPHHICSFPNYVESLALLEAPENNDNLPPAL